MKKAHIKIERYVLLCFILPFFSHSQVVLKADGPGQTYELISSVLAPGKSAVEAPDHNKLGNHTSFGRHIAEVWDADLKENVLPKFLANFRCTYDGLDRPPLSVLSSATHPSRLTLHRDGYYRCAAAW